MKRRKLQMFYNIQHDNTPDYLSKLIPPTLQTTTIYPLRNGDDIIVPFSRLSVTTDYFIPSTIRQWNSLDLSLRKMESISKFKNELKEMKFGDISVPKYYSFGPRKLNIILTQLKKRKSWPNRLITASAT